MLDMKGQNEDWKFSTTKIIVNLPKNVLEAYWCEKSTSYAADNLTWSGTVFLNFSTGFLNKNLVSCVSGFDKMIQSECS